MSIRRAIFLVLTCHLICASAAVFADPPALVRLTRDGHFKQRPAWSPDGKQVLFSQHQGARIFLVLMSADGSARQQISRGNLPQYDGSWSPDGKRIALTYVKQSGTQGDLDIYTSRLDGQDLKPLAMNTGALSHEESPAWSPDGKRIAFTSTAPGNQELFVIASDGAGRERLTSDPAIDAHPGWSPDSRRLVFATNRWGDLEIASIGADGTNLTRLTESRGLDDYPVWSPDGTRIAFASHRDGNFDIYVCDADGAHATNMTRDAGIDNYPAWSPDGRLTFISNRDGGFDLYQIQLGPTR